MGFGRSVRLGILSLGLLSCGLVVTGCGGGGEDERTFDDKLGLDDPKDNNMEPEDKDPEDKDPEDKDPKPVDQPWIMGQVSGPRGSAFTLNRPGYATEELRGEVVIPWEFGQLLNLNHFALIRFRAGTQVLWLRYSMAKDRPWQEEVYREHMLRGSELPLQETQQLDGTIVELYVTSGDLLKGHALGQVTMRRDVTVNNIVYALVGELDVQWNTDDGWATLSGGLWIETL